MAERGEAVRIPKRTTYSLLLSLLALNFVLRYPWLTHEAGFDGFIFHGMTRSLVDNGYASWILNPLSYLGLYPLSQPSGSVFLLGGLSQVSGTPIEAAIIMLDWMIVAIGMMAAFFRWRFGGMRASRCSWRHSLVLPRDS